MIFLSSCSVKYGADMKIREDHLAETPYSFEADYYFMRGYESFISRQFQDAVTFYKKALDTTRSLLIWKRR